MKDWLINVGIQKMGPSLIRAMLAGFVGILLAHAGDLSKIGIGYDQASDTVTWHLSIAREWLGTVGLGLVAALFAAAQHHVNAAISGTPHTGANQ